MPLAHRLLHGACRASWRNSEKGADVRQIEIETNPGHETVTYRHLRGGIQGRSKAFPAERKHPPLHNRHSSKTRNRRTENDFDKTVRQTFPSTESCAKSVSGPERLEAGRR
jgi:hypothetical protein